MLLHSSGTRETERATIHETAGLSGAQETGSDTPQVNAAQMLTNQSIGDRLEKADCGCFLGNMGVSVYTEAPRDPALAVLHLGTLAIAGKT